MFAINGNKVNEDMVFLCFGHFVFVFDMLLWKKRTHWLYILLSQVIFWFLISTAAACRIFLAS